jgi:hemolysin activation/secretion protein
LPALVALPIAHAQAQVPPSINPGGIQQEQLRQQQRLEQQAAPPKQQGPGVVGPARQHSPLLQPGGPKFKLKKIEFDGESKFLSKEELDAIVAPLVGHDVDFAGLSNMIAAINDLYTRKGIVTGIATLPEQDVKDGIVTVKLTEGKLEKMTISGNDRTWPWYILSHFWGYPTGDVLDVPKLNRDVTWFNRTSETQIRALLSPGSTFGLTDVNLAVTEAPVNTLQIFADNQGVEQVGRYEYGMFYKRSGVLGIDDRLTFYGTKSEEPHGNKNGNLAYNVPFNPWGGRIGVSYTQGETNIIHGPFADLRIKGDTWLGSVNMSQPAWVDDHWLLLANLATTYQITESRLSDVKTTDTRTQKRTAGFSLTNSGEYYSVSFAPAANLQETVDEIAKAVGVGQVNKVYALYNGTMNGLLQLPLNFSVSSLGGWQYTTARPLPGDQLFQIGGPTTVRGYPTNTVAGFSGYYANLELHRNMTDVITGLDAYLFFDRGEVWSSFPSHTWMESAGGGVSWTYFPAVTIEAFAGAPLKRVLDDERKYQAYFRLILRPLLVFEGPPKPPPPPQEKTQ